MTQIYKCKLWHYRETMESMLTASEQHFLRSPLLDNSNLTLEERALLAARSQLFLRAAAAAAAGPYSALGPMCSLYGASSSTAPLWSQWACLGPSLFAQQQLAAATSASPALPRPVYPGLSQHRFAPYCIPIPATDKPTATLSPVSSPDSVRDSADQSPHSP